jgi:CheY-like chemotaxis protein
VALKILLADDSMTAQNMGKKILADAGYDVVAVSNGAAALKKIAEISPQLCILDIYMPGYTGLEVCEKVKAATATARMPVLLTVGKMEPYKPEEGARVRADGVIVKPFEASELLRAVQRFSQRLGVAPARPIVPAAPLSAATFERALAPQSEEAPGKSNGGVHWNGDPPTHFPVPRDGGSAAAIHVEDVVASTKTTSTADAMPNFAIQSTISEHAPVAVAEVHDSPALASFVREGSSTAPVAVHVEAETLASASAVLPGFVDYLIAHPMMQMQARPAAVEPVEIADSEPVVIHSVEGVRYTGAEILSDELPTVGDPLEIPAIDPSLDVAPEVSIEDVADPDLDAPQEITVENATEEGLQPTSRAAESEGVATTTDPDLAPMEGLIDAVKPLEGGRLVIPEDEPATAGMAAEPPANGAMVEEIAAVLDLLDQTTKSEVPFNPSEAATLANTAAEDSAPESQLSDARVWMAQEVALTESEATISLEKEMRRAYAPTAVEIPQVAHSAIAVAEEPLRDDNIVPKSAMPGMGGSPPTSGASPTEELAAAMAAAFGGALPKEDLARAEETQSISEEVRRFALGDAYKPKPAAFGGAAIDDGGEKVIDSARLTAAIGRALDRMKPQLVAEILHQLNQMEKE